MVAVRRATSFSLPAASAKASVWARVRVRPALMTRPRATIRSPAAGATRLILNSVVTPRAGRHEAKSGVPGRTVHDRRYGSRMDEAMLLGDCRARGELNVELSRAVPINVPMEQGTSR